MMKIVIAVVAETTNITATMAKIVAAADTTERKIVAADTTHTMNIHTTHIIHTIHTTSTHTIHTIHTEKTAVAADIMARKKKKNVVADITHITSTHIIHTTSTEKVVAAADIMGKVIMVITTAMVAAVKINIRKTKKNAAADAVSTNKIIKNPLPKFGGGFSYIYSY